MPHLLLTMSIAAITGVLAGGMAAWWFMRHGGSADPQPVEPPNEWVSAEIDRAAADWAMSQGRPEAAGLMADKLRMLHALGQRRQEADQ